MSEEAVSSKGAGKKRPGIRPYHSLIGEVKWSLGWMKACQGEGQRMKALNALNAAVDVCVNDPDKQIPIPQDLVAEFKQWYMGPCPDHLPSFRDLKPYDRKPQKGYYVIGRPVPLSEAWAGYDPAYVAFQAGFSIPITDPKTGGITREPINLKGSEYTNTVSISWWNTRYHRLLRILEPLTSQIEVHIAKALKELGAEGLLEGGEEITMETSGEDIEGDTGPE